VIDPFARESRGGEQWGKTLGFEVDAEDLALKVFSRPQDCSFHGISRLPVFCQEKPTVKIPSRPSAPQHSLEQSIVYECHLRGLTCSSSSAVANSVFSGTYKGLVDCIPHLKTLGVTAV
jgi:pullulanase/glycogen debranching enzyme